MIHWIIFLPLIFSMIISLLFPMDKNWYRSLQRSDLTPPDYTFSIVWTLLYLLLGVSLYRSQNPMAQAVLVISILLGYLWVIVFNYFRDYKSSFLILILNVLVTLYYFRIEDPSVSALNIPYLIWLIFATGLNYQIYALNP